MKKMKRMPGERVCFTIVQLLIAAMIFLVCITGCTNASHKYSDSYSSGWFNTSSTMHSYRTRNGKTAVLEYENMETGVLCNKPNCTHDTAGCLVSQLGDNVPLIANGYAFYFKDDGQKMEPNEDGKLDLVLSTNLYRYDFGAYTEERLLHIDNVSATKNCYGWLLHDNTLWFIGNWHRRNYDENGIITSTGNTGGRMELYSIDLSTMEVTSHGDLYDIDAIEEYYPEVIHSGEVSMKGLFDNKIYFQVAFVDLDISSEQPPHYVHYVKYYDLETGEFAGDPTDYSSIDFSSVSYLSDDYLVISGENEMTVYSKGTAEPIVLTDDAFYADARVSVFDDMLFFYDKVYDLNTKACKTLSGREETIVVAEYEDSYIISAMGGQGEFEKVSKSDYLAG